jgi:hypothetical protein
MKVKITRPDGTVIEAEGTSEELAPLVTPPPPAEPIQVQPVIIPFYPEPVRPSPPWPYAGDQIPWPGTGITWGVDQNSNSSCIQ